MLMEQEGERWWLVEPEGPILDGHALVECALSNEAEAIVVPTHRLPPAFFQLKTGVAGEILQKLTNYRIRVGVVGDVELFCEASEAFRDFVRESNRGRQVAFQPDMERLLPHMSRK
jgi:hypothetical protein